MAWRTNLAIFGVNDTKVSLPDGFFRGDKYLDPDGNTYVLSRALEALSLGSILQNKTNELEVAGITVSNSNERINKTGGFASVTYIGWYGVITKGQTYNETFKVYYSHANYLDLTTALMSKRVTSVALFHPNHVIKVPANTKGAFNGVATCPVDKDYYFWRQVSGIAQMLISQICTGKEGESVTDRGGTAGQASIIPTRSLVHAAVPLREIGTIIRGGNVADSLAWVRLNGAG